jgi:hypothetical protein
MKSPLMEEFLEKSKEWKAAYNLLATAREFENEMERPLYTIATEYMNSLDESGLKRLIWASLPEDLYLPDNYDVANKAPELLEKIEQPANSEYTPRFAEAVLRRASPWKSQSRWEGHFHLLPSAIERNLRNFHSPFGGNHPVARFCHDCIKDYICPPGKACLVLTGNLYDIALTVRGAIARDDMGLVALGLLTKLDEPGEE